MTFARSLAVSLTFALGGLLLGFGGTALVMGLLMRACAQ